MGAMMAQGGGVARWWVKFRSAPGSNLQSKMQNVEMHNVEKRHLRLALARCTLALLPELHRTAHLCPLPTQRTAAVPIAPSPAIH